MWHEDDLRAALRMLEREAPAADATLRRVTELAGAGQARPRREGRPGRRLVAGAAAAAAVITIAAASLAAAGLSARGPESATAALRSVPRYYLALIPASRKSGSPQYGIIRDTLTGRTLATVRPPRPFVTFTSVTGAADDRTFVLTAQASRYGNEGVPAKLFSARFNPADGALRLSALAIPAIPSIDLVYDALSPDGTRLAVAVDGDPDAQLRIYSLPSGKVRIWRDAATTQAFTGDLSDALSWSRAGRLVFGWHGTYRAVRPHHPFPVVQASAPGSYLLNTAAGDSRLLADSRFLCLPIQGGSLYGYGGYLTPDGSKLIVPVNVPVKPGQRPARCTIERSTPKAEKRARPKLETFSVATGRAIGVIYRSPSRSWIPTYDVMWSSPSGSVLVIDGPAGTGRRSPSVYGVLSGGRFTPISKAPDPYTSTLAF